MQLLYLTTVWNIGLLFLLQLLQGDVLWTREGHVAAFNDSPQDPVEERITGSVFFV